LLSAFQQSDSWQCIDVTTELESCGGCVHGQFGAVNGTLGEECVGRHALKDETLTVSAVPACRHHLALRHAKKDAVLRAAANEDTIS